MELRRCKEVTYDFTHWASDCLLIHTIGPGVPYPACVDHTHDGLFFKAMRAFLAADGILHGEQSDGALSANSLGCDFEVVVFVFCCAGAVGRGRVEEPCG